MHKSYKLRFAVMCDGTHLKAWQAQCIRELVASKLAEPVLLIQPIRSEAPNKYIQLKGYMRRANHLLFLIYNRFWVKRRSEAHKDEDCGDILGHLPTLQCDTEKVGKFRERFSSENVESISSHNLDFILRFAFNIIEGRILSAAKHGVWSFHHGDDRKYRGAPPGFWECFYGDPLTGVVLQRLTESLDAGQILHRGMFKTHRSYTRNVEQIHMRATYFPVRACKVIIAGNSFSSASGSNAKIYKSPDILRMTTYVAKRIFRLFKLVYLRLFFFDIWNVGFVEQTMKDILKSKPLKRAQWVALPNAHKGPLAYIADPFGYEEGGELQVLVEDYHYELGKGIISKITLPGAFKVLEKTPAIRPQEHLSYPLILNSEDGKRYCIPESGDVNKITLYQEQSDGRWLFNRNLIMGIAALDTTYVYYNEKHWLFFTLKDNSDQLHAYYSDALDSQWRPHTLNPLKDDITCSRPAGGMFFNDGNFFRPAQDGTETYGSALRIMRVNKLTCTEFEEEEYLHLLPDKNGPFPNGLHTINSLSNGVLVDGKRFRFKWNGPLLRLRWKVAMSQYAKNLKTH